MKPMAHEFQMSGKMAILLVKDSKVKELITLSPQKLTFFKEKSGKLSSVERERASLTI